MPADSKGLTGVHARMYAKGLATVGAQRELKALGINHDGGKKPVTSRLKAEKN